MRKEDVRSEMGKREKQNTSGIRGISAARSTLWQRLKILEQFILIYRDDFLFIKNLSMLKHSRQENFSSPASGGRR